MNEESGAQKGLMIPVRSQGRVLMPHSLTPALTMAFRYILTLDDQYDHVRNYEGDFLEFNLLYRFPMQLDFLKN
jgi:hypothetical protein